jgi:hypothetical protein
VKPFLPPLLLFVAIVAAAPFVSHLRDAFFATFPRAGVRFLEGAFAAAVAGFFVYAVARIRDRRWLRYGALAVVAVLLWVQTVGLATDLADVNAVEKVHVVEYGALAFLLYRAFLRRREGGGDPSVVLPAFFAVTVAGAADEAVQWVAPLRTGEIRDVALNAAAGATGLLLALSLRPPASWTWRLDERRRRRVARGAALTALALGLFFHVAHLGYEIADPEIGRFRARFTAAALGALAAARRRAWAAAPPTGLETWGVEDYFLTEAAWHANHRNASYRAGLFTEAWLANRVLEKYYDPFLDLESFRGSGRHRYPPAVRRELDAKKGGHDPRSYLSPVLAGRIRPWPKPLFLSVLGILTAALWTAPGWLNRRARSG